MNRYEIGALESHPNRGACPFDMVPFLPLLTCVAWLQTQPKDLQAVIMIKPAGSIRIRACISDAPLSGMDRMLNDPEQVFARRSSRPPTRP